MRLHTGASAARSADALDAQAYTYGRDIVFAAGALDGDSSDRLLLHELVHVAQNQGSSTSPGTGAAVAPPDHQSELEAERMSAFSTGTERPSTDAGPYAIHRQPRHHQPRTRPESEWRVPTGRWILVDLPDKVYLYEGFRRRHTFNISGGMEHHLTPTGEHEIDYRDVDHRSSEYGRCIREAHERPAAPGSPHCRPGERYRHGECITPESRRGVEHGSSDCRPGERYQGADMAYFQRFAPLVGFHRGNPNELSHGCIHVAEPDIQVVWEFGREGMKVVVCNNCTRYLRAIEAARDAAHSGHNTPAPHGSRSGH